MDKKPSFGRWLAGIALAGVAVVTAWAAAGKELRLTFTGAVVAYGVLALVMLAGYFIQLREWRSALRAEPRTPLDKEAAKAPPGNASPLVATIESLDVTYDQRALPSYRVVCGVHVTSGRVPESLRMTSKVASQDVAILMAVDKVSMDRQRYTASVTHAAMYPCLGRPGGGGLAIQWPPGRGVLCGATVTIPLGGGKKEFDIEVRDVTSPPGKIERPDGREQSLGLDDLKAQGSLPTMTLTPSTQQPPMPTGSAASPAPVATGRRARSYALGAPAMTGAAVTVRRGTGDERKERRCQWPRIPVTIRNKDNAA